MSQNFTLTLAHNRRRIDLAMARRPACGVLQPGRPNRNARRLRSCGEGRGWRYILAGECRGCVSSAWARRNEAPYKPAQYFGKEATAFTQRMVERKAGPAR